jgi:hypothetical protein
MKNNKSMIEKLEKFADLARDISDEWQYFLSPEDFQTMNSEYPFDEDFQDIVIAIRHWADTQKKYLK